MSKRTLRKLAKRIFDLTRHEFWLGGKVEYRAEEINYPGPAWPSAPAKQPGAVILAEALSIIECDLSPENRWSSPC